MRKQSLKKLVKNVKAVFTQLKAVDLHDLDDKKLQQYLDDHDLAVDDLTSKYGEQPKVT